MCRPGRKDARGQTKRLPQRGGQNAVRPDTLIPRPRLATKPGQAHTDFCLPRTAEKPVGGIVHEPFGPKLARSRWYWLQPFRIRKIPGSPPDGEASVPDR